MKPKFRSLIAAFAPLSRSSLIVCASLCAAASIQAQTNGTWITTTSGTWSTTTNWADTNADTVGDVADGVGATADFSTLDLPAAFTTVTLDSSRSIGAMTFGDTDTATAGSWGVSGATPNVLTLATSTGKPTITANVQTNINAGFIVGGTNGFRKEGAGTLRFFTNSNTLTGGIDLNAGILAVNRIGGSGSASANVGTGAITIANGATLRLDSGGNTFVGNAISTVAGATAIITSANATNGYSGAVTGAAGDVLQIGNTGNVGQVSFNATTQQLSGFLGTVEIFDGASLRFSATSLNNGGSSTAFDTNVSGEIVGRNNGTVTLGSVVGTGFLTGSNGADNNTTVFSVGGKAVDFTFGGVIRDANTIRRAALTKVGAAVLTLSGTNTFNGATLVNDGTLKYTGSKTGTGTTTVNTGATLTGNGSIAGTTTIANGGKLTPGDAGTGNLSFANLTLNSGSTLKLGTTPTANKAVVQAAGTLTLASGISVDVSGFGTDGTYDIIDITGANPPSGSAATALTAINTAGGKVYTFGSTATAITMTISGSDPTNFWNVDGAGTWNLAGNWTKSVIPNAIGAFAKVGPGIGGAGGFFTPLEFAITLDGNQTVGTFVAQTDNLSTLTIDPGTPAGTLSFDNGASPSILSAVLGGLIVNAPVAVDAQGLAVDVAMRTNVTPNTPFVVTLNGAVSGPSAALTKAGLGTLVLAGNNTYGGGTVLSAGIVNINSATSLGDVAGPLRFSGGTLQLGAALSGITRGYQVAAANNALIDTNGFAYGYDGVISPYSGGTGGLTKSGVGTLTLTAAQTYTGATTLNAGNLVVSTGASISGSAMNVNSGTLTVAGGSLTASATSAVTSPGIAGFALSSGSATFAALNGNTGNPSTNIFLNLTGGTFSATSLSMGRCATIVNNPTAASNTSGLYVNGAIASITGALNVGSNNTSTNSTSSARMDSGSLTVDGAVSISVSSPDRWSLIDLNGGTFTSTNVATGVQIGTGQAGSVAFLVRNGTATVERFLLQQPAASVRTSLLNVSGGTLYVGAGGIVGNNNAGTGILSVQLGNATLGAKASWGTLLGATLNGTTTIKAADAADAPFDIAISGVLGGTGGFNKTGGGKLTLSGINTYSGNTTVSAGTLEVNNDDVFDDASTVTIVSGATLNLTHSGTDKVGVLVINGVTQLDGVYTFGTGKLEVGGSAYTTWANSFGLQDPWLGVDPALNGTPGADPDNDGVANSLEFALGGNPTLSSTNILPTLTVTATDFIYTFNRVDASEAEVALTFQSGTTLAEGSWTSLAIGADTASSGSGVVVAEGVDPAPDVITVTIAKGANTKLFGRLQAVK